MKKTVSAMFLCVILLALYLPIFVLALYSFTDSANIGAIHGFSVQNYVTLFTKPELRDMITGTILLALGSALLSTVLGTLGAVGVHYSKRFGKTFVGAVNQVPVVNAEVVTAFSLCILLIEVCSVDKSSFLPLLIGHVVLQSPVSIYSSQLQTRRTISSSDFAKTCILFCGIPCRARYAAVTDARTNIPVFLRVLFLNFHCPPCIPVSCKVHHNHQRDYNEKDNRGKRPKRRLNIRL